MQTGFESVPNSARTRHLAIMLLHPNLVVRAGLHSLAVGGWEVNRFMQTKIPKKLAYLRYLYDALAFHWPRTSVINLLENLH